MSTSTVRRAVARVLKGAVAVSVGIGGTALAQTAGDSPADAQIQEVRVTGSRIQLDGMTTPTPVTSVSVDDLHVLAPTTLGAAVTQLPQFINSSVPEGAPSSGWTGASGASILNLRGVGQNRTLVLLDGRRVVPSSRRGTLDVNLLPEPLVSRVEVVTGGASAAYGSDAVSGVVNFLLDTEFTGFKSNIQGGVTELGDNENYSVQLSGGMPLGERTHIIASAEYYHVDAIKDATERDWQQSWGVIPNPRADEPGQPARITRPNVRSRQFTEGGLILSGPLAFTQFLPGGVPAPFVAGEDASSTAQVGGDGHDLAWFNYFTPETTRGSAFAHLNFEINDNASAFIQGLYGANETTYLSPPAGAQFATWAATIYRDNAFLPESIREQMGESFRFGRAGDLDYGASKAITQENTLRSFTTGLKARWGDWRLDAYYQYGKTDSIIDMDNAIRLDRVYQAIDAVRAPNGEIVCNSTLLHPDNGCVPMNVFGVGSPSQEAIDWITQDISQKQEVQQHVADIAISGVPFDNWVGPVSVATGVSWRRDSFRQDVYPVELHEGTDMPLNDDPSLGYRGLPAVYSGNANIFERGPSASPRGSYDVKEVFAEMQMPLLGETALTRALDVNTAVRFADYEGSGGVWAWKAGLDWQVTDALRFRFTRSRDVRAGTLSERFDSSRGPGNVTDPTTGSATPYAISVIAGGNPEVDPEKADTVTFGVVYQPGWLEGFAVSVDAFDIDIDGAIGQLGAQEIVDQCYAGATQLCQFIERGEDGFISIVKNLFINTDQSKTRGVDLEASYTRPLELFGGGEVLSARLLTTFIDELSTTQAGAEKVDRAGQTGVAGGAPDWQASLSLTYERGAFSVTLQERYIDSGLYDATWVEGVDIDDNTVDASLITNLQLAYGADLRDRGTYRVSLNVSNLFDEDPPLAAAWGFTGSRDTNSSLFDIYGRRYTLGVRFNF